MKKELINQLMAVLDEYHSLGMGEQTDYQKSSLYSLITHSTALEGSTVTEMENQMLFDEGITARGRSLQEQMMNLDLKAAYEHAMRLAGQHTDFSVAMLKSLAALVMKNTGTTYSTPQGSFDASKGDLRLQDVTDDYGARLYVNYMKVPIRLKEFCENVNRSREMLIDTDEIIAKYLLSFDVLYQLGAIHPWADGNGRMSRLVMNYLQYEYGLVPVKILKEDKADYAKALTDSREMAWLEPFREFMMKQHIRNVSKEIEDFKKAPAADSAKPATVATNAVNTRKNAASDPINVDSDPIKNIYSPKETVVDPIKVNGDPIDLSSDSKMGQLYECILMDNSLNYAGYGTLIGVSEATVKRRLGELKRAGIIIRVGSNKTGHWEVVKQR